MTTKEKWIAFILLTIIIIVIILRPETCTDTFMF